MTHPRIAAFLSTWLLLTAAVAVWCCALRGEDEISEPPATEEERAAMAAENYGGPIKRWRENRPKPIQKIVHDAKETTANTRQAFQYLGLACAAGAIGMFFAMMTVLLRRRN